MPSTYKTTVFKSRAFHTFLDRLIEKHSTLLQSHHGYHGITANAPISSLSLHNFLINK